ncbi:HET-domain-containing protein [Mytilinidion resinicola]|uniref:HET-domain-containing protein n=1 Tax=Mytilinidion resinicola TaxID=574789 RepID=A0A6A6Y747_9PEZI|nr:HET-domain-containing protein [Mytilinidion resinicola]KAF2804646.1 HET-domain-containing protein [Mytilinidion resinicola]
MPNVSLCERCLNINFGALRYPTISDIKSIQASQRAPDKFPFKVDGTERPKKVDLGLLSDIKNRKHCKLCTIIWRQLHNLEVAFESGSVKVYSDSGHAALGQEVTCHATIALHWGLFRYDDSSDSHPALYRLSIHTYISPTHEHNMQPHMYIDHYFQSCDIGAGMETVRFVDVRSKSIKTFHNESLEDIRYIALSYVWGKPVPNSPPVLELTASSSEDLEADGALDRMGTPKTIQDVIDLAIALGIQYVWIDRLCIRQDSNEDKGKQIGKMHAIYNASYITVVAAAGIDVHHGLPGFRPDTRHVEQEEVLVVPPCETDCRKDHAHDTKGMSLLTSAKSFLREEHYLEDTTWNRRGWTMQERVLARRSLIFTDEQVYWACSDATFFEDSFCELAFPRFQFFSRRSAELNLKSSARTYSEHRDPKERSWATYTLLVRRYSKRLLSFEGDGHDAFAAILQALEAGSGETFIWGLPASHFELGLSWTTFEGQQRRTEASTLPMTSLKRRVHFPSWSWLGWVGETHINVSNDRLDTEQPTIKCYVHELSPETIKIVPVWSMAHTATTSITHDLEYADDQPREVTLAALQEHLPSLTPAYLRDVPAHHLLFFWAATARFRIALRREGNPVSLITEAALGFTCIFCHTVEQHISGSPAPPATATPFHHLTPQILNAKGDVVGTLCRMREKHWAGGRYETELQEFIVVGRRHIAELGDEFPATLLVMQVERKGEVWERVNMGEIEEGAWKEAGGEWKLVVLG